MQVIIGVHPHKGSHTAVLGQLIAEFFGCDDELARKVRYAYDEPALRAATLEVTDGFVPLVANALARASKREPDDLEVQVIASVLVWSLVTAVHHWHTTGYQAPLAEELDKALDVIDRGLLLDCFPMEDRIAG
jgi:MftR C-terminal domain